MEGVGARLGRFSARYGPAAVFTGPVRKWKKRWIPYIPPATASHHHKSAANNVAANGGNSAHLVLYKWAPIAPTQNGNGNGKSPVDNNDEVVDYEQQAPKRKFKYIPVAVLEEQRNETSEPGDDEAKPMDIEADGVAPTSKTGDFDGKPDINDIPAEENQAQKINPLGRQDLNETLDLSLGLKAHDGEDDSDSKANQKKEG